ncbi:MAG: DUF4212 domain-containing protein [Phycisphaerales bacterium]|nr:DUF4212 domain-containing protein [Phycisphaerales bacterium]MCB9837144.1 DUF4212 domain-containing protein [Phycisphaera sp.]
MSEIDPNNQPVQTSDVELRHKYWQENIRYVLILLAIWFVVSYGFGILLADWLNQFKLPGSGFKLGFWFAQQGSIYSFVLLIVVYVRLMSRLDRKYGVAED